MATKQKAAKASTAAASDKPAAPSIANAANAGAALAPAAAPKPPAKPALPEQVTLASLHGFYDDDGVYHGWVEGQVVTDPAHIELLIARGAPLAE